MWKTPTSATTPKIDFNFKNKTDEKIATLALAAQRSSMVGQLPFGARSSRPSQFVGRCEKVPNEFFIKTLGGASDHIDSRTGCHDNAEIESLQESLNALKMAKQSFSQMSNTKKDNF